MLVCDDVVIINLKDSTKVVPYKRTYFEYGPQDKLKTVKVTSKGKELGTRQKPAESKSVHKPNDLFVETIEYLKKQDATADPLLALLSDFSDARDLKARAPVRTANVPQTVDVNKALDKIAKVIMSLQPSLSLEQARALAKNLPGFAS